MTWVSTDPIALAEISKHPQQNMEAPACTVAGVTRRGALVYSKGKYVGLQRKLLPLASTVPEA